MGKRKELKFQVLQKRVFKLRRVEQLQWKVTTKRPNLEEQKTHLVGLKYFMSLERYYSNLDFLWMCTTFVQTS